MHYAVNKSCVSPLPPPQKKREKIVIDTFCLIRGRKRIYLVYEWFLCMLTLRSHTPTMTKIGVQPRTGTTGTLPSE